MSNTMNALFASSERLKTARPPLAVPTCAACREQRTHTPAEWKNHPLAGHGFTPETGWSHSEAKRLHFMEVESANAKRAALAATPEVK